MIFFSCANIGSGRPALHRAWPGPRRTAPWPGRALTLVSSPSLPGTLVPKSSRRPHSLSLSLSSRSRSATSATAVPAHRRWAMPVEGRGGEHGRRCVHGLAWRWSSSSVKFISSVRSCEFWPMSSYSTPNFCFNACRKPLTVVEPSFCGSVLESEPKWMCHGQRVKKMVAFERSLTGRRFLGCVVQVCEELVIFSSIVLVSMLCCAMICYNWMCLSVVLCLHCRCIICVRITHWMLMVKSYWMLTLQIYKLNS